MSTMSLNRVTVDRVTVDRVTAVPPGLRLTRRGRAVVTVAAMVVLLVAVVAVVLLGGGSAAAGDTARPVTVGHHVVMPGETLWQIAVEADPSADPRDTIVRIRELNHLQSAALPVGVRLAVPAAG